MRTRQGVGGDDPAECERQMPAIPRMTVEELLECLQAVDAAEVGRVLGIDDWDAYIIHATPIPVNVARWVWWMAEKASKSGS